jgi:hypothetical protein
MLVGIAHRARKNKTTPHPTAMLLRIARTGAISAQKEKTLEGDFWAMETGGETATFIMAEAL